MAVANITYISPFSITGTVIPNVSGDVRTENITTGTSSVAGTLSGYSNQIVRITASGPIYVAFGVNPTASATNGILIQQGQIEYFAISNGQKVAVIDA